MNHKRYIISIVFTAALLIVALNAVYGQFDFPEAVNDGDSLTAMRKEVEDLTIPYQRRLAVARQIKDQTGVLPWTPMSSKELGQRLYEQKATVKQYQSAFPQLRCVETQYFLLASDAPPAMYQEIQVLLDKLYNVLCEKFNVPFVEPAQESFTGKNRRSKSGAGSVKPMRKNIWQAKCVVVVFMKGSDFELFESRFFQQKVSSATRGMCHQFTDGKITIACRFKDDKFNLYSSLTHETTHGFSFMHRAAAPLPLWLNEGVSDWTARTLVPQATLCPVKQKQAVSVMQKTHSLGGMFHATGRLEPWQYGASAMIVNLLLKRNPGAFVDLINDVKDGVDVEQALIKHYNLDFAALANQLGRACGVAGVRQ